MVTLLRASALGFDYPGLRALDGIDLELEAGELCCVLGPNGSGKSTLLSLLGGRLTPTRGGVSLGDQGLGDLSLRERALRIATVPQNCQALPGTRANDFVSSGRYAHLGFWRQPSLQDRHAVQAAMETTEVTEFAERGLDELSGGQRQRVLIARALAQEADVLLFDEPTASLDPRYQILLFDLIRSLVERGRLAFVATHELNLASRYADRCVLLDAGRMQAMGTPADVLVPAVLEPVYGPDLFFTSAPGATNTPLVLPWPRGG